MTSFLNVVLVITFYQTGPDGLFYFSKVFNLILQSAKIIKNPDLILIANIVLMVVPLAIILFIMWNFYDKLHREFSGSNRKILTWLIFYIYVVNIGIALTYTTTKNIPPVYFFFGIVLLLQSIFAIGIYFLMQKNQKELLKKQRMRN